MSVTVETLAKLERKVAFSVSAQEVKAEVEQRLRKLARTVRMDGFRPGKIPMNVMGKRYGLSVQYEVVNDKLGQAFTKTINEAQLRVAGRPRITEREDAAEGELGFEAVFEVFPEVVINDLAGIEIEKLHTEVTESAIDRTVDILRKQRRSFTLREPDQAAQDGDRVTVDFEGKIDGQAFAGGEGTDFQFLLGEGQMLKPFEDAARGMKVGESRTFPLVFPDDYHGKEVAGKAAEFVLTMKKIEAVLLPELDAALIRLIGVEDGSIESMRADIKKNLEREVKFRLQGKNKQVVMDALIQRAELDLPRAAVDEELARMIEAARADLRQRGMKDADEAPVPESWFRPQAEQRVRVGLVVAELVRAHDLDAKQEQVTSLIEELASSYEKPDEVIRWYYSDVERMNGVKSMVLENNVTEYVLSRAKVVDKYLSFDELMGPATT